MHAAPPPQRRIFAAISIGAVCALSLCVGLLHGLLITRVHLQPFVVTLCGLLLYRGFVVGLHTIRCRASAHHTSIACAGHWKNWLFSVASRSPSPSSSWSGYWRQPPFSTARSGALSIGAGPQRRSRPLQRSPHRTHENTGLHYLLRHSGIGRHPLCARRQLCAASGPGQLLRTLRHCRSRPRRMLAARGRGLYTGRYYRSSRYARIIQCHQRARHTHSARVCHYWHCHSHRSHRRRTDSPRCSTPQHLNLSIGNKLAQNASDYWGANGRTWIAQLPSIVERFMRRWSIESIERPFPQRSIALSLRPGWQTGEKQS